MEDAPVSAAGAPPVAARLGCREPWLPLASVETSSVSPSVSRSSSRSPRSRGSGRGSGTGNAGRLDELAASGVPVYCLDPEPPLEVFALLDSFSLRLWSTLSNSPPVLTSPFQQSRTLSPMQHDCLVSGSDDKTPRLGDHSGTSSLEETFSRHDWVW